MLGSALLDLRRRKRWNKFGQQVSPRQWVNQPCKFDQDRPYGRLDRLVFSRRVFSKSVFSKRVFSKRVFSKPVTWVGYRWAELREARAAHLEETKDMRASENIATPYHCEHSKPIPESVRPVKSTRGNSRQMIPPLVSTAAFII
eukprot:9470063-Pyramimonas_sp.AAC.2